MIMREAATAIIKDYDLPITPDRFIQEIRPMNREKWVQAKALPGANRLIMHLHKHEVPFALASNSILDSIDGKISHQEGWKEYFSVIVGSDQVKSGRPSPNMIGVQAAKAAGMKVVAVPSIQRKADQFSIADSVLQSLVEFHPELWGLPPFEDWVDNALPVEPFYLRGLCSSGLLNEFADCGPSVLPDQVSGLYFGWAKVDTHEMIFKVVVSIGWDPVCCTAKRKIRLCLVDGSDEDIGDQQMQVMLVGYIRGLSTEENTSTYIEILEEDHLIAAASLELPMFAHYTRVPFF